MPIEFYGSIVLVLGLVLFRTSPWKSGYADSTGHVHPPGPALKGQLGRILVLAGLIAIAYGLGMRFL